MVGGEGDVVDGCAEIVNESWDVGEDEEDEVADIAVDDYRPGWVATPLAAGGGV